MKDESNADLRKAIDHLERGEWEAAHLIVQEDEESRQSCWLHGIVHVLEGDAANAGYWFDRAGRTFSTDTAAEIAAAKAAISES
jgi:hypothetical protein